MNAAQTHNPHTDSVRHAYHAAVARQPVITKEDSKRAAELLMVARGWTAEAWKILQIAPQFAEPVEKAGRQLRAIAARLELAQTASGASR